MVVLSACGTMAGVDGDAGADAGVAIADAGVTVDASVPFDAGAPVDAGCVPGALWCDDFSAPTLDPRWTLRSPNCSGSGSLALENGAVRVAGAGGYCNHVFLSTDVDLPSEAWVRARVRFESALGDGHVTFFTSRDQADQDKDLRMGGQAGILMWNRESDDATLPSLSPQGIAQSVRPAPGQWFCLEIALGAAGTLSTFVDGQPVPALQLDATPTAEIDQQWLSRGPWRPRLRGLSFGWEGYAGQAMTLWFDDVALSTQRPGCP